MENTNPVPDPADAPAVDETAAGGNEALGQLINEYEAKLGEMRDILLRERAELENQRKRLQRDLEQARRFANERLLGDLLPVLDNHERGLAADRGEAGGLRSGVELTLKEFLRIAASFGLAVVDPAGAPFDPERHQAMTMVDTDAQAPGTVVTVLQKGYLLNERLLRPAMVSVAQAPGG